MLYKKLFVGISMLAVAASSFASPPTILGQISLDYVGMSSNNGTFEWRVHNTTLDVFTYCFSTSNDFSPSENPQVFNVWTIAGSSVSDIDASSILSHNTMSGLSSLHFLEAAAQAESYGTPGISNPVDTDHNNAIHQTESVGDSSYDSLDYSHFYYLEQANPTTYGYAGQPQGFVGPNPPTPEPASLAAIGLGLVGLVRKRRKA